MSCCGKLICTGCIYANALSNIQDDEVKVYTCVLCRTSALDKEEYKKRKRERIEANDPEALRCKAAECYNEGNHDKAFKYWTKAAEVGSVEAHYCLGSRYGAGVCVEKDKEKAIYHLEKAAIGGHPDARHNLAFIEAENGNIDRSVKHDIIAANLGHDNSMKALLSAYKNGFITKEEYGATLRTHQAAIDATKSSQRDAAKRFGISK